MYSIEIEICDSRIGSFFYEINQSQKRQINPVLAMIMAVAVLVPMALIH